jgi:hypothetical protein
MGLCPIYHGIWEGKMTIEELDEICFLNSNQYFLGYENIEVKRPVLEGIAKRALMHYGNYRPIQYRNKINLPTNTKIKELDGRKIETIRELYMIDPLVGGFEDSKMQIPWEFNQRLKILLIPLSTGANTFFVDALVRPTLEDMTYDDELFVQMCSGLYLMYVGEARKAFSLEGLPFANDAEELYSEGKELYENALEELKEENSSWWYAIQ